MHTWIKIKRGGVTSLLGFILSNVYPYSQSNCKLCTALNKLWKTAHWLCAWDAKPFGYGWVVNLHRITIPWKALCQNQWGKYVGIYDQILVPYFNFFSSSLKMWRNSNPRRLKRSIMSRPPKPLPLSYPRFMPLPFFPSSHFQSTILFTYDVAQ